MGGGGGGFSLHEKSSMHPFICLHCLVRRAGKYDTHFWAEETAELIMGLKKYVFR